METRNEISVNANTCPAKHQKPEICVVHLVWVPSGLEPLKRFLSSYSAHRAGIEHDLLVIFNGFNSEHELAAFNRMLTGYKYKSLLLWEFGLDINSYFLAVKEAAYKFYCFLNSYSIILDADWLLKMRSHIRKEGIGLVGATGSYESFYTNYLIEQNILDDSPFSKKIKAHSRRKFEACKLKYRFDLFPNYHIRSNAFMISRDVLLKLRYGSVRNKMDTYKFESGKKSMTKQVMNMNLKVLVVGRDGIGYEKETWYKSKTFRQGDQSNLLISDNQTNIYIAADPEMKVKLARYAWGNNADANS